MPRPKAANARSQPCRSASVTVPSGQRVDLAIIGGFAGLIAIGCLAFTALATMVWNT